MTVAILPHALGELILQWFDLHGRKGLPWQQQRTPYSVWVSEIMLQQTQVSTVIPYYERFMARFPNVSALAAATEDEVLEHWSGLGYYARGRNLHKAAQQVVSQFSGEFPAQMDQLVSLPGIGRSTAAAILSIAFGLRAPILDGNVKRVLSRLFAVNGWSGQKVVNDLLWRYADALMPASRSADYTQAIMDLGATLCTRARPACPQCPLRDACQAFAQGTPTAYPQPKPRKSRPRQTRQFLLLLNQADELWLQRRPSNGLWGGLWSLPELDAAAPFAPLLQRRFGMQARELHRLPVIKHAFSHFDLDIHPLILRIESTATVVMEMDANPAVWYNTAHELPGGLPAPVSLLIGQCQEWLATRSETQNSQD